MKDVNDLSGTLLDDHQLMALLGLKKSAYYKFKAQGVYDFLRTRPHLGGRRTFSGTLVQKWLEGEDRPKRFRIVARTAR